MGDIELIDKTIKEFWATQLVKEYENHHLLKEDSLKCVIYHYLRSNLSDGWLLRHRIRIYPEFLLKDNKKADIAIVKICPKGERVNKYLGDCIEEVLAIIELKYKSAGVKDAFFYSDVSKLHEYAQVYPECQLYAGFIHEEYSN
ncbi:MAG: hypothetical protein K8E24_013495, partial [Methanobacterium paludis]|nr:hypothetical protein [Methanobacterium paludis]